MLWLLSLFIALSMIAFLTISFFLYHRKVSRRRREADRTEYYIEFKLNGDSMQRIVSTGAPSVIEAVDIDETCPNYEHSKQNAIGRETERDSERSKTDNLCYIESDTYAKIGAENGTNVQSKKCDKDSSSTTQNAHVCETAILKTPDKDSSRFPDDELTTNRTKSMKKRSTSDRFKQIKRPLRRQVTESALPSLMPIHGQNAKNLDSFPGDIKAHSDIYLNRDRDINMSEIFSTWSNYQKKYDFSPLEPHRSNLIFNFRDEELPSRMNSSLFTLRTFDIDERRTFESEGPDVLYRNSAPKSTMVAASLGDIRDKMKKSIYKKKQKQTKARRFTLSEPLRDDDETIRYDTHVADFPNAYDNVYGRPSSTSNQRKINISESKSTGDKISTVLSTYSLV